MLFEFAPKLANLVTSYSVPIEKGDFVVIQSTTEAIPYMEALAVAVLERGGVPHVHINLPLWGEYFLTHATDEQIAFVNPISQAMLEKADVLLTIDAPAHTSAMISLSPETMQKSSVANHAIQQIFMQRLGADLRWCLSAWPTIARAQQANMSFYAYQRFIYEAYALHLDDPAAYWHDMASRQERYIDWLMQRETIEVRGQGVNLTLSYKGRNWYAAPGHANFPDGEILTCPLEDSLNGTIEFSYPAFHAGTKVEGVRLVFKDGRIVEASARENEDYLLKQIDIDENARRIGEFAIGTNDFIQTVTGSTLLDEKIGGTMHMALGASAAPHEGKNPSKIHWDIVHDLRNGGEMYADGELFYKEGNFLIE
ncbi:MAG: aminopeptidase [Aggregatilineales bacterium]